MTDRALPRADFSTIKHSTERFTGEQMGMSLSRFSEDVTRMVSTLYTLHQRVLEVSTEVRQSGEIGALMREIEQLNWSQHVADAKKRLVVQENEPDADAKRRLLHDVRGGAFSNISLLLDLMRMLGDKASLWHVERLFFLVRDHLKIMRNCFTDLDATRRQADLQRIYHSTALLREKWDGYKADGNEVAYHSDRDVDIASCCIEFSTLDRVLYNLVNNALRHTDDAVVELYADVLHDDAQHEHLQLSTCNEVTDAQRDALSEKFGNDASNIFAGGFSTTGSGLGLSICTECVTNAYHIGSPKLAIEKHYVGARLEGNKFYAWVHWPVVAD